MWGDDTCELCFANSQSRAPDDSTDLPERVKGPIAWDMVVSCDVLEILCVFVFVGLRDSTVLGGASESEFFRFKLVPVAKVS